MVSTAFVRTGSAGSTTWPQPASSDEVLRHQTEIEHGTTDLAIRTCPLVGMTCVERLPYHGPKHGHGGFAGIGLALVRSLVELHGGSVTAFSAGTGRGSEFTVRLPVED